MPHTDPISIDFKAVARAIRANGIIVGMEANRLAEAGKTDRAHELNEAASSLDAQANQIEEWRRAYAKELRFAAEAAGSQHFAQSLEGVARQLDPQQVDGGEK